MTTENPYSPPNAEITDEDSYSELASRWMRLGGVLIDGLLMAVITIPLVFMTGYLDRVADGTVSVGEIVFMGLLSMVVFFLLNSYLLAKKGQTVGKLVVGTQIVSAEDGSLLPFFKLIGLRYIPLWLVSQVPGVGPLIGLLNAAFIFSHEKRCLHDLIAGTRVINYRAA